MTTTQTTLPNGAWPVLLTPFTEDRTIDWHGLDQLVDYYVAAGVAGLFAVCLSGEMFQLSRDERLELAKRVVWRANGKMPVVASAVASSDTDEQVVAIKEMHTTGVAAVVLLPCLMASEQESDAIWFERLQQIVSQTGEIKLGFYECPRPYKRAVPVESIVWAARSGRFLFHKDTTHNLDIMRAKIAAIKGTNLKFYNTQMGTLIDTLKSGGHGFSSYAANIYPELVHWVCLNFASNESTAQTIRQILSIAEHAINNKYPASAKLFIRENAGVKINSLCRATYDVLSRHEMFPLIDLMQYTRGLKLPVPLTSL